MNEEEVMKNRKSKLIYLMILIIGTISSCAFLANVVEKNIYTSLEQLPTVLISTLDGGVIFLNEGEYDNLILNISKRTQRQITIKPKVPGSVKLTGNSTIFFKNSSNIKLEGLFFEEVRGNAIIFENSQNIGVGNNYFLRCGSSPTSAIIGIRNGSSNNEIYQNTFENNHGIGITIVNRSDAVGGLENLENRIYRNLFYNIPRVKSVYPQSGGNGMEAIQIGQTADVKSVNNYVNTKIYENLFEQLVGDGLEIISNKSSGNEIINNTFLDNRSGITLRAGNDVKVEGNYLLNTEKGIRLFGYGHRIKNNYIDGAEIGIRLPAADFKVNEDFTTSGYHQQENCDIENNVIIAPRVEAISIGEGERELLPRNIRLVNNRTVITNSSAQDYVVSPRVANESVRLRNNQAILNHDDVESDNDVVNQRRRNSVPFSSEQVNYIRGGAVVNRNWDSESEIKKVTGQAPYNSLDTKVGADWKRPIQFK